MFGLTYVQVVQAQLIQCVVQSTRDKVRTMLTADVSF